MFQDGTIQVMAVKKINSYFGNLVAFIYFKLKSVLHFREKFFIWTINLTTQNMPLWNGKLAWGMITSAKYKFKNS